MALLKNLLAVDLACADQLCFVLKRVPHIWLILTLLTLFSFQGTQLYFFIASDDLIYVNIFSYSCQLLFMSIAIAY